MYLTLQMRSLKDRMDVARLGHVHLFLTRKAPAAASGVVWRAAVRAMMPRAVAITLRPDWT